MCLCGAVEPLNDEEGFNLSMIDGQVNPKELARFVRTTTKLGVSAEDSAKLAAYKSLYNHSIAELIKLIHKLRINRLKYQKTN